MSLPSDPPSDTVQATLEEGPGRYAVFANRLRTAFTAGLRYSAYSSELGEAFRPLTKPIVVRSLYGISWSYVIGDVIYSGYQAKQVHEQLSIRRQLEDKDPQLRVKRLAQEAKDKLEAAVGKKEAKEHAQHAPRVPHIDPLEMSENTHVALTCARRAVFQSLASMALPAFTVHSIVHYSQPLFKNIQSHRLRALGPTVLGLSIIPALPIMFDEPVEHVIDTIFDWGEGQFFKAGAKTSVADVARDVKDDIKTALPGSDGKTASAAIPFMVCGGAAGGAGTALAKRRMAAPASTHSWIRRMPRSPASGLLIGVGVGAAGSLLMGTQRA